jgi:hypothetical protein
MNGVAKTATNRRGQDRRLDFVNCLINYKNMTITALDQKLLYRAGLLQIGK